MLIKAGGLIEDNFINGSTLGGIIVTPELSWGEADFVHNLTIQRNTITNVGYGKQSYGAIAVGATAYVDHQRQFDVGRGHRNVALIGNTVSRVQTWGLWVTSSANVTVRGNRFEQIWQLPTWATCCPPYPVPPNTVIFMTLSTDVTARDNCIIGAGEYATTLVNITPTVTLWPGSQSVHSWSTCRH